ncbi:MAG: UDP-N-acetylmuramoyl-L-alanyl-D-glutamate--2,6-diaminopimelate ligase [Bacteroidetes bacterium]|nr:UDP-N-acetylmuramoyl-L-alanyl-D-glutamate--2,6-diaminopimelate ligase [Bacteroidota bacterium]
MRLHDIIDRLEAAGLEPVLTGGDNRNFEIDQLASDSRRVGPDGLFVAIRGTSVDGHLFIDKAVTNGAIAIVHEAMPADLAIVGDMPSGIASVHVDNSAGAYGIIASALNGDPSASVGCIGITGTNGKTTTSFLLWSLFELIGERCGLIGTIEYRSGRETLPSTHTTPDAAALHSLLAQMRDAGCSRCAMEVSSHALVQERVAGVNFRCAAFTNLTQDHLDYHGTMDAYLAAKKRLFDGLSADACAVTNLDDPAGRQIVGGTDAVITTYGRHADADIRFEILDNTINGLRLKLDGSEIRTRLVGDFNAYNLAASYAVAVSLGVDPARARGALSEASPVPGRFERIDVGRGAVAIVDYAHTPDALENVLKTAAALRDAVASERGSIVCVFGCGGDRDRTKRPLMGAIAERYADRVLVTNDNPRTEDPAQIFDDIRRGMNRPEDADWITDRARAIRSAVETSRAGDIIIVAGKGHETYQINGTEKIHFDDREVVRSAASGRTDTA